MKTIIFIHAFPLNQTMWQSQVEAVSKKYRAIAYDVRGLGKSEVGDGQFTLEFFVDDLIALMDHQKIDKAILCGLSMGGYIALRAVERNPERFKAIILADTQSNADGNEAKLKRAVALKQIKEKGLASYAEGFVKAVLAPETFKTAPKVAEAVSEMVQSNTPLGVSGGLLALATRTDTTESLQKIKIPTLILVGEKDTVTPPSASLAMKEKIPNAEMHIIPGVGHLSNLENPAEFNQKLLAFLDAFSSPL